MKNNKITWAIMAAIFLFHLLYNIGFFTRIPGFWLSTVQARAISVFLILLLVFSMSEPSFKNPILRRAYMIFFIVVLIGISAYAVGGYELYRMRAGSALPYEVPLGLLAIIVVLEGTRRTTGNAIVIVALVFIAYALVGDKIPGFLRAPPTSVRLLAGEEYIGIFGIYGVPIGIILNYVFSFLLFSRVLEAMGGMQFFADIATRAFGRTRGAGSKIGVVTNFLFGMVQGSTVAGVLVTSPLAIPRMRKEGHSEHFMGGLIAAAANGAQIMPPVMGVVAFAMADFLQVPYIKVAYAAFLPGALFYFGLFMSSHFEVMRTGVAQVEKTNLDAKAKSIWSVLLTNWYNLAGIILLVALLVMQNTTVPLAVLIATGFLAVVGSIRKATRPKLPSWVSIVKNTAKDMTIVAPVCACAGIIIGAISMTSLDYKLSVELTGLAGNNLYLLLIFATIACFILGMGIPTLPAYIIVVLIIAPTITSLGVAPLVAHMFVFYMALTAMITPPVCINVFTVQAFVKAGTWKIGIAAVIIGIANFIVPFMFVYRPALLLLGTPIEIVGAFLLGAVSMLFVAVGFFRYGLTKTLWWEIVAAFAGAFLIYFDMPIFPGLPTQIVGAILLVLVIVSQVIRYRRARTLQAKAPEAMVGGS